MFAFPEVIFPSAKYACSTVHYEIGQLLWVMFVPIFHSIYLPERA